VILLIPPTYGFYRRESCYYLCLFVMFCAWWAVYFTSPWALQLRGLHTCSGVCSVDPPRPLQLPCDLGWQNVNNNSGCRLSDRSSFNGVAGLLPSCQHISSTYRQSPIGYSPHELLRLRKAHPRTLPSTVVELLRQFGLLRRRGCRGSGSTRCGTNATCNIPVIVRPRRRQRTQPAVRTSVLSRPSIVRLPTTVNITTVHTAHHGCTTLPSDTLPSLTTTCQRSAILPLDSSSPICHPQNHPRSRTTNRQNESLADIPVSGGMISNFRNAGIEEGQEGDVADRLGDENHSVSCSQNESAASTEGTQTDHFSCHLEYLIHLNLNLIYPSFVTLMSQIIALRYCLIIVISVRLMSLWRKKQGCRGYEISHPYPYPYPRMPVLCRRVCSK